MRLLEKLIVLRDAASAVIEELGDAALRADDAQEEAEILLTRSAKNRRSDKNAVMTMSPLNGAPAVPESWKKHVGNRPGNGKKNRAILAMILERYEPMARTEVWKISRQLDTRLKDATQQKNFQQMVNRMFKLKQLRLKNDNLVMGV